jgi:hypothetical protein
MTGKGLPWVRRGGICKTMASSTRDIIARTPQPRYPNGERKLSRDPFMQATWVLLGVAALGQLVLLVWLDVMS